VPMIDLTEKELLSDLENAWNPEDCD
jgi:hypothetical protein